MFTTFPLYTLQHAQNVEPSEDGSGLRTDASAQRRRDRMLAASLKERVPDVMTLGSIVAAASAVGSKNSNTDAAPSMEVVWDDSDCYFHGAISEGHWLALLVAAGLLNDTVGLGAARSLFVRFSIVLRV